MLARIQVASPVRRGQAMEVRFSGTSIAKTVIHSLSAEYGGRVVFRARMGSGVAANPLLQFWVRPDQSGDIRVVWEDDQGVKGQVSARIEVLPA